MRTGRQRKLMAAVFFTDCHSDRLEDSAMIVKCYECGTEDIEHFTTSVLLRAAEPDPATGKRRRFAMCRECRRVYYAQYRERHKQDIRDKNREYGRTYSQAVQADPVRREARNRAQRDLYYRRRYGYGIEMHEFAKSISGRRVELAPRTKEALPRFHGTREHRKLPNKWWHRSVFFTGKRLQTQREAELDGLEGPPEIEVVA